MIGFAVLLAGLYFFIDDLLMVVHVILWRAPESRMGLSGSSRLSRGLWGARHECRTYLEQAGSRIDWGADLLR